MSYTGFTPDQIFNSISSRYFYGLRLTHDGELFFGRVDQLNKNDSLTINNPGPVEDDYPNFEEGQDFFEGRNIYGETIYKNLNYEQHRWDNRSIYYYINDEGELVARINQLYAYDENSSSAGNK